MRWKSKPASCRLSTSSDQSSTNTLANEADLELHFFAKLNNIFVAQDVVFSASLWLMFRTPTPCSFVERNNEYRVNRFRSWRFILVNLLTNPSVRKLGQESFVQSIAKLFDCRVLSSKYYWLVVVRYLTFWLRMAKQCLKNKQDPSNSHTCKSYLCINSKHITSVPNFFHQFFEIPFVLRTDCGDVKTNLVGFIHLKLWPHLSDRSYLPGTTLSNRSRISSSSIHNESILLKTYSTRTRDEGMVRMSPRNFSLETTLALHTRNVRTVSLNNVNKLYR